MIELLAQFGIFLGLMAALALWSIRRTRLDRELERAEKHRQQEPVTATSR